MQHNLDHRTGHRKSRAGQQAGSRSGQAGIPEDKSGSFLGTGKQCAVQLVQGQFHGAKANTQQRCSHAKQQCSPNDGFLTFHCLKSPLIFRRLLPNGGWVLNYTGFFP